jgi:hypothetical protein
MLSRTYLVGGDSMSLVSPRRSRRFTVFLLLIVANGVRPVAAEAPESMPELFPGGAIAYAELSAVGEKLNQLRESEHIAALWASPQYAQYEASANYRKLQAVLEIAERQLGWDAWTTAQKLLGGRLAIGVYPKEGSEKPDVLAILRTTEPTALTDLRQRLDPLLVLAAEKIRRTESLTGVEMLSLPDDVAILAWKGDWLAIATSRQLLDEALRRLADKADAPEATGLIADASFQAMVKAVDWDRQESADSKQRIFRGYVDTALVNKATGAQPLPQKLDNPLGSLLFSDVVELVRTSPFAAATIDASASGISIVAAVGRDAEKLDEPYRAFFPAEGAGALPPPRVPDLIGGFTLYRNFAKWYSHREDLLQEQVMPGFDKFETGLANLLPGRDFGQDVLPLLGSRITFVAAPQSYAHLDGEPGVKLPGMALIVELAKPDEATALLQLFFQTLAAILNLEAGQQGRQPWVVTSENYNDVQVSYARYLKKPAGKDLGIVFNFLPASARVDDRFILSSSLPLCKQLIDSMRPAEAASVVRGSPDPALVERGSPDPASSGTVGRPATAIADPPRTMLAELRFDALAGILDSNADFFIGRMTQEGRTTEEAQSEFTALVDLLRRFDAVEATTEVLPNLFQIRLEGKWK